MRKYLLLLALPLLLYSCSKTQNSSPGTLPNAYSNKAVGASAYDMLNSTNYSSLTIQVQYMPGYAPDSTAMAYLQTYLQGLCNKPGGITITQSQIPSADTDTLNVTNVAVLEASHRTAYASGTSLGVYIIITDSYDSSGTVLGFAYRNTSICLFGKNIFANSGGRGQNTRTSLEASVLEHEFGHIMGLVNLGTPMVTPHQDVAHGNHCTNPNCLMYWETELYQGRVAYSKIATLDSNCMADLVANGAK